VSCLLFLTASSLCCPGLDVPDCIDRDGDGYGDPDHYTGGCAESAVPDCNDEDAEVYPGAVDVPGDGIDCDCDGGDAGTLVVYVATPDGDTATDVFLTDVDGSFVVNLTETPGVEESAPLVSPDRTRIVYLSEGEVWTRGLFDLDMRQVCVASVDGYGNDSVVWAGDEHLLVSRYDGSDNVRTDLHDVDGSGFTTVLTEIPDCDGGYTLTDSFDDGTAVVVWGTEHALSTLSDLYFVSLDGGGEPAEICTDRPWDDDARSRARLSPSQQWLAWTQGVSGVGLYVAASDGSGDPVEVHSLGDEAWVVVGWSADETRVYLLHDKNLASVDAGGGGDFTTHLAIPWCTADVDVVEVG